ncbi:hypothetical protein FIBSPDRAFT_886873 [Athelia psychrophila]|uniref:Uncharacterized protein n=1 Tax=Athelia psychrophila TaxID=1759441 RepID=A0A166QBK1_9AGAM|nr:hypothetical protein FIBSPDRAFT_886873 [Fibularhizoctonia sp. CBS 109695]
MSDHDIPEVAHHAQNPRLGMQPVPAPNIQGELDGPTQYSRQMSPIVCCATPLRLITGTLIAVASIFAFALLWFYVSLLLHKFCSSSSTASPTEYESEMDCRSSVSGDLENPLSHRERHRLGSWLDLRSRERFNAQSPDLTPRPIPAPRQATSYFSSWSKTHMPHTGDLDLSAVQRMSLVPHLRSPPKALSAVGGRGQRGFVIPEDSEYSTSPAPSYAHSPTLSETSYGEDAAVRPPTPSEFYASPSPSPPRYVSPSPPHETAVTAVIRHSPIPAIWDARREKNSANSKYPAVNFETHELKLTLPVGRDSMESLMNSKARAFSRVRDSLALAEKGEKGKVLGDISNECNYF